MDTKIVKLQGLPDDSTFSQLESFGFCCIQVIPSEDGYYGLFKRMQYPDWNGLYKGLLISQAYQYVLGQAMVNLSINAALTMLAAAIQYGISGSADNEVSVPAFQQAIDNLLHILDLSQVPLSESHLAEVKLLLKTFGFTSILLGQ